MFCLTVVSVCDPGDTTSTQLQYCEQISSPHLTPLPSPGWLAGVGIHIFIDNNITGVDTPAD